MAKISVSVPQGTRDFGPDTVRKRTFILDRIRQVFECYGFQPLETPAMENLDTLMGKYGEEGDKLIFKILNNGLDNPSRKEQVQEGFEKIKAGRSSTAITERALRYDLTIPFARYVAMNHGQLSFPFRRYQIQPVWRADRPQKGRYREFYQCDADIVGSYSLLNELELATIYLDVFKMLQVPVELKVNNRKVLTALAALCKGADQLTAITTAIDKLDKIGLEKVKEELSSRGLDEEQVKLVEKYLAIDGNNEEKLEKAEALLGSQDSGRQGLEELAFLTTRLPGIVLDFTLARGLNYYTGSIFEVKAKGVSIGSIGGGGRYDDLTGLFGVPGIPGIGISFGIDRIYDVMEELKLFPETVHIGTQVLFFNCGSAESEESFRIMQQLRQKGIRAELFHETVKFDKQFKYAEKKNIPFVIILGEAELKKGVCQLKDIRTGKQEERTIADLLNHSFV